MSAFAPVALRRSSRELTASVSLRMKTNMFRGDSLGVSSAQEATFNSAQTQTRAHLPSPFCPNQTVPRLSVLYFESVTYSAASPTCPATPNCPVHPPAPSIANHCKHDIYAIVIGVWIAPLKFYGRGSITQCWRPGRQPETIFGLFHDKRYANESQSLDRNGGRC